MYIHRHIYIHIDTYFFFLLIDVDVFLYIHGYTSVHTHIYFPGHNNNWDDDSFFHSHQGEKLSWKCNKTQANMQGVGGNLPEIPLKWGCQSEAHAGTEPQSEKHDMSRKRNSLGRAPSERDIYDSSHYKFVSIWRQDFFFLSLFSCGNFSHNIKLLGLKQRLNFKAMFFGSLDPC